MVQPRGAWNRALTISSAQKGRARDCDQVRAPEARRTVEGRRRAKLGEEGGGKGSIKGDGKSGETFQEKSFMTSKHP